MAVPEASFLPTEETVRISAIRQGGVDPASLRFRIVEYAKSTGEPLGIRALDLGFSDAYTTTCDLILQSGDSHFCLEPTGFVQ